MYVNLYRYFEALRAIAETGDSAAMFRGMVPPLAAAIDRLYGIAEAESKRKNQNMRHEARRQLTGPTLMIKKQGTHGQDARSEKHYEEQLRVARRMA